jgi:hypothetical protein
MQAQQVALTHSRSSCQDVQGIETVPLGGFQKRQRFVCSPELRLGPTLPGRMGPVRFIALGLTGQYGSVQGSMNGYMDVVDGPGAKGLGLIVIQVLNLGPTQILNPDIPRAGFRCTRLICS